MNPPTPPPVPAELDRLLRRMRLPYLRRSAPDVLATARAQRWDASADLGPRRARSSTIDTLLDSYTSAGGSPAVADETAFTGAPHRVSCAAFLLWVACGH